MNNSVLHDIMLYSLVKVNVSEEHITMVEEYANHEATASRALLHAGFLHGLLFNPEDEGDMFL
jgi:hypothetical protein